MWGRCLNSTVAGWYESALILADSVACTDETQRQFRGLIKNGRPTMMQPVIAGQ
jgi:hypothetical protein